MKYLLKLTLVILLLVSCNLETKKINNVLHESEQMEKNVASQNDWKKIENELLKKTPLTDEELLSAFPKELMGYSLDKVITIPNMQQVVGQFGNRKISLSIADAAGEKNSLATTFIGNYSFVNPSTENRKFNNIERSGIRTISDYNTYDNATEMWLLYDNRYFISL